jgi:ribosomal protein S27AE
MTPDQVKDKLYPAPAFSQAKVRVEGNRHYLTKKDSQESVDSFCNNCGAKHIRRGYCTNCGAAA